MSAEKKHDYHLVDPSPWPIYVSFSCLVLAIGTIFYMHNDVSWGMYLGLALVLYGAYMWFRDVVIEAEHQGHHTPVVQIHHRNFEPQTQFCLLGQLLHQLHLI